MDARKVLIIEDEKAISDLVKFNLIKEGFETDTAYDGQEGLDKALAGGIDLVLLDVMLPTLDGFEICRRIRDKSEVPIIMLTAKEEEVDKVLGLELGADDYITKPFGLRELIARIKANTRRVASPAAATGASSENVTEFGDLAIDLDRYEIRKRDIPLELTLREFELLRYLAEREDKVITREQLLEDVWGYEYYGDIRTVDVTVRRLREKLEDDSSNPAYVLTKRGVGYYFRRP
ncbi:MAG: response regulator transcription factor [Clostridiales Family XIII bacterium]|jgi:two-component system response regulator VicR|nr:response regulator transcription factor [Clostridiales Family XIII bacterium]